MPALDCSCLPPTCMRKVGSWRYCARVDVDLSEPTDGGVTGMAYEVEEEDWPAVLEALDIRERHGYTR